MTEFKTVLHELDDERLSALIKHRRSKRGSITGHAARLFLRDASACGMSVTAAVDTCISRNWITVKPEYFANRSRPSSQGPPKSMSARLLEAADKPIEELIDEFSTDRQNRNYDRNAGGNQGFSPPALRAIPGSGR